MHPSTASARRSDEADQLIARVLHRAHATARAQDDSDEVRAVLDVAQSFADELATANPRFDRLRFIEDATDDPSDGARPASAPLHTS